MVNPFSGFADRYQPELFSPSKDLEMLEVNGSEEEKVVMNVSITGRQTTFKETFAPRSLVCPSGDNPTHVSGLVVYISTTLVCKCCFRF